jgi:peptidoglycan hydrolase-like protein with peptidoglycan-binding domain
LRLLAVFIVALWLVAVAPAGQSTAKKKTAPAGSKPTAVRQTASAAKAAPKKSTASTPLKTSAAKAGVAKTGALKGGTKSKKVVARRPPVQQQPSSDRYKEIQQALADKGYFRGPADGAWSGDSVDALKRFQKDQNLDPDGKIGALSLMALGLGPKHGAPSAQAARGAVDPVDPPPVAQPPQP